MLMVARPLQRSGPIDACRLVLRASVLQNPAQPGDLMQYVEQSWDLCGALGLNYMKKCEPLRGSCLWRQLWYLMLLLFMNRLHVRSNFTFLCIPTSDEQVYSCKFFFLFCSSPVPDSHGLSGAIFQNLSIELMVVVNLVQHCNWALLTYSSFRCFFFFFIPYSNSNSN